MRKVAVAYDPSNMAFWKRQRTKMAKRSVVTRGLREGRREDSIGELRGFIF